MTYTQPKCRRCAEQPASIVLHAGRACALACGPCAVEMLASGVWDVSESEALQESQTQTIGAEQCAA